MQGGNEIRPNEITIDEAVKTLKEMFVGVDETVVKLILESNGGRMEPTVENLLLITGTTGTTEVASNRLTHVTHGSVPGESSPVAPTREGEYVPPSMVSSSPKPTNKLGQVTIARHDLDREFLRAPSYWKGHPDKESRDKAGIAEQEKEDMLLAQMLQDSLFMSDLKKHPEWLLQNDKSHSRKNDKRTKNSSNTRSAQNDSTMSAYDSFKDKVSELGTAARSKLSMLAEKFQKKESHEDSYPSANYHALESIDDTEPNSRTFR